MGADKRDGLLSSDALREIHDAAIRRGLDRDTLLEAVAPDLKANIPARPTKIEQILTDLAYLNNVGQLQDGSAPLALWLDNAISICPRVPDRAIFVRWREAMGREGATASTGLASLKQRSASVRLAALAAGLLLLSAAAIYLATSAGTRAAPDEKGMLPCEPGRQLYQGRCVSNQMIDFVVCLEANDVTSVLKAAQDAVRDLPENLDGDRDDQRLRESVEGAMQRAPAPELEIILKYCKDVAERAKIHLPDPPPPVLEIATVSLRAPDPGCTFRVNGHVVGTGPSVTVNLMTRSTQQIQCSWLDGSLPTLLAFNVGPDANQTFSFPPNERSVIVMSAESPGCRFWIDGKALGQGTAYTWTGPSGHHSLRCDWVGADTYQMNKYRPSTLRDVKVTAGNSVNVSFPKTRR